MRHRRWGGRACLVVLALAVAGSPALAGPGDVKPADLKALRAAIEDLSKTYSGKYARGAEFLRMLGDLEKRAAGEIDAKLASEFRALQSDALLSNPLLNFDRLLLVKRSEKNLALPQNWQANSSMGGDCDNEIAVLSPVRPTGKLTTLFKPKAPCFVGDVDLHFDADRMLFSMNSTDGGARKGRWLVYEMKADGSGLRPVTAAEPDADSFDACYLPDGRVLFASTAAFHGIPCVGGGDDVANLFLTDTAGKTVRQLTFDQDQDWHPAVMNDGRVFFLRWEYSDLPHYFSRVLFAMNPDGTGQMSYYGSNSYWPNSLFFSRPVPGSPTKFVGVVSGHHGVPRMGELFLFDTALGRTEGTGVVQRIPTGGKKFEPVIADGLVENSWPKFLHPYPLSEKHFLVSAKLDAGAAWGLFLVDVFDNMVPILQQPGQAILEPLPLRKIPKPPVIPDKVKPERSDATVFLTNIYAGPGMRGVPRGTVKKLRIVEFHYAYPRMGGHINIGVDGPWDVHRILGTVPILEDGSAVFKIPANMPVALQALDERGQAVQMMRSWFTAMPGETVSCLGCHEKQNAGPPPVGSLAAKRPPAEITPWYGPARGFSFKREVQPVLDKFCVGCHDGTPQNGRAVPNFNAAQPKGDVAGSKFDGSYLALHPYVRRPGPESDMRGAEPYEWHASTSELVQMLNKGHYNVKLDAEAWDRLVTWIDLNVPDHGTWGEHRQISGRYHQRRMEARKKFANRPEDPEAIPATKPAAVAFVRPDPPKPPPAAKVECPGWPFDAAEARKKQDGAGYPREIKVDLGGGQALDLVLVPAGEFVMGDATGAPDEAPLCRVRIPKPFYMSKQEVTNRQYHTFDPSHDAGYVLAFNKDHSNPGQPADTERRPVIRVSWKESMGFCEWLTKKGGRKFTLPTEAQWEYACRAGTATLVNYGEIAQNFGKLANLADQRLLELCIRDSPKWLPCMAEANDGAIGTDNVGRYPANAWGLFDMHGNAAEWTLTTGKPYPYVAADGRDGGKEEGLKVVRGGSFYDRPQRARSGFRLTYEPFRRVFNVGFRVVCEVEAGKGLAVAGEAGR
jgi:formylglycine-generating enzyme required for sulfatase activity